MKMADPTGGALTGSLTQIVNLLVAAGGLGTAAMGLVDASKVFGGGPSNFGFGYVADALDRFLAPLASGPPGFGQAEWLRPLVLTRGSAQALAYAAGVDPAKLQSLAEKTAAGANVTQDEINVLGQ